MLKTHIAKVILCIMLVVMLTTALATSAIAATPVDVDFVKSYMRNGEFVAQYSISCIYGGTFKADLIDQDSNPVISWPETEIETLHGAEPAIKSFAFNPTHAELGDYQLIVTVQNANGQLASTSTKVTVASTQSGKQYIKDYTFLPLAKTDLPAADSSSYTTGVYRLSSGSDNSGLLVIKRLDEGRYVFEIRSSTDTGELRMAGILSDNMAKTEDGYTLTFSPYADGIRVSGDDRFSGSYSPHDSVADVGKEAALACAVELYPPTTNSSVGELVDGWFWSVTIDDRELLVAKDLSTIYEDKLLIKGNCASMLSSEMLITESLSDNVFATINGIVQDQPEADAYYAPYVSVLPERYAALVGEEIEIIADVPAGIEHSLEATSSDRGVVSYANGKLTMLSKGSVTIIGTITVDGNQREFTFDITSKEPEVLFAQTPAFLPLNERTEIKAVTIGATAPVTITSSDSNILEVEGMIVEGKKDDFVTITATSGELATSYDMAVGTVRLYEDLMGEVEEGGFSWAGFFIGSGLATIVALSFFLHRVNRAMGVDPNKPRR